MDALFSEMQEPQPRSSHTYRQCYMHQSLKLVQRLYRQTPRLHSILALLKAGWNLHINNRSWLHRTWDKMQTTSLVRKDSARFHALYFLCHQSRQYWRNVCRPKLSHQWSNEVYQHRLPLSVWHILKRQVRIKTGWVEGQPYKYLYREISKTKVWRVGKQDEK